MWNHLFTLPIEQIFFVVKQKEKSPQGKNIWLYANAMLPGLRQNHRVSLPPEKNARLTFCGRSEKKLRQFPKDDTLKCDAKGSGHLFDRLNSHWQTFK